MRIFFCALLAGCMQSADTRFTITSVPTNAAAYTQVSFQVNSWEYFLQHLAISKGIVVDYEGKPVANQSKQAGILSYDVGTKDLQQCADALMRLRAEYLFGRRRYHEIGFHFTSGHYYSFEAYCKGKRPLIKSNKVLFTQTTALPCTKIALRNYLDIVYAYAGTISLYRELKPATDFGVGTIIITAGSPGHCCIIVDEKRSPAGERLFKLVEGYSPAQTIYLLSNPYQTQLSPWYQLKKGSLLTASYEFENYALKKF